MRALAWALLMGLAFAIPWEYSLDLGPPVGNIARILGLALLLAMAPAVLQAGRLRRLHSIHWLALGLLGWFALSFLWSVDSTSTAEHLRGNVQEFLIAWYVWELADSPREIRWLLRATVAGSCVLALLTLADFVSLESVGQVRFVAEGQDPNDVARFLDFGFPLAALLADGEARWGDKLLTAAYLPLGMAGVLLTASRSGLIAAAVALGGCGILLARSRPRTAVAVGMASPLALAVFWWVVPQGTIDRLLTIPQQLSGGTLNQRLDIWEAGWQAFIHAPIAGSGAGTFVSAAALAPIDTAHNTALAIAVEGGMVGLMLAAAIVAAAAATLMSLRGGVRIGLAAAFLVIVVASLAATVHENRATWMLLGLIAAAGRLTVEEPGEMAREFSAAEETSVAQPALVVE